MAATSPMTDHMMQHQALMTITDLPTDVLSCVVDNLQQDIGQEDRTLDDIAALRSVCRSLRHAVDLTVTHAKFHPHVDDEALRSMTRRCAGESRTTNVQMQSCNSAPCHCSCRM